MKTISISHSKGGSSKSTLCLNFAPLIKNLVLIDLDNQQSSYEINQARNKKHKVVIPTNEKELFTILDKYEENSNLLIDCGGYDSDLNRLAILNSDILIVPVKDNSFEILAFKKYIKVIEKLVKKNPELKVLVVISNVHHSSNDFERLEKLISKYDFITLAKNIIRQRADFANLLDAGTTAVEKDKKSKAAKEITKLYKEIKDL